MGSAPTLDQTNKGIDDRTIKLGCVQPGESPATFGDALRRLANRATYLVEDSGQYWYALGQTIGRTAADRAQSRFLEEHADEEIRRRLLAIEGARRLRGRALGAAWAGRGARRDGGAARRARARASARLGDGGHGGAGDGRRRSSRSARRAAAQPQHARLRRARQRRGSTSSATAARSYLAWKSIWDEKEELNLDELSRRQAETQRDHFDETVNQRIGETFVWVLVPVARSAARPR